MIMDHLPFNCTKFYFMFFFLLFWQLLLTGVNEGFNEVTFIVGSINSVQLNPTEVTLIRSTLYDFIKSFSEGFSLLIKGGITRLILDCLL